MSEEISPLDFEQSAERRLRRVRRQLARERIIFTLVIGFLVAWIVLLKMGSARRVCFIVAGDQLRVAVESREAASRVLQRLRRDKAGALEFEGQVKLDPEPTIEIAPRNHSQVLSEDEAYARLAQVVNATAEVTVIYVNGEPVLAVPSNAEARSILESYRDKYARQASEQGFVLVRPPEFVEKYELRRENRDPARVVVSKEQAIARLEEPRVEEKWEIVQRGDTVEKICHRAQITRELLQKLNPGVDLSKIDSGDELLGTKLLVRRKQPYLTVEYVVQEERVEDLPFEREVRESAELPRGQTRVLQPGRKGRGRVVYTITYHNAEEYDRQRKVVEVFREPQKEIILKGTGAQPVRRLPR